MDRVLLDTQAKLRPGDLVRGDPSLWSGAALFGIVINLSSRTNVWADTVHRWWFILLCSGELVEDTEEAWNKIE